MRASSFKSPRRVPLLVTLCALGCIVGAHASSHREAPFITTQPKVDGTDFYMFNSYEGVAANGTGGRAGFVTPIANDLPLQDGYGGPNHFSMDPNALDEIHGRCAADADGVRRGARQRRESERRGLAPRHDQRGVGRGRARAGDRRADARRHRRRRLGSTPQTRRRPRPAARGPRPAATLRATSNAWRAT